jgi:hypothetical protein
VTVPRIPPPLALRIDRLAWRAHVFHRFAHHPLCDVYRSEVLRIGKRFRVCKGCTFLGAGLIAGIAGGAFARLPLWWGVHVLLLGLVLGAASLVLRLPKLMGRLIPGAALGISLWAGWQCALSSLLAVTAVGILYRRRGVNRRLCETCDEREYRPCSGFASIVRRERAFRRRANRWLGVLPGGLPAHTSAHGRHQHRM